MPRALGTAARREPSHAGSWYDSDGEPWREGVGRRSVSKTVGLDVSKDIEKPQPPTSKKTRNSKTASVLSSKIDAWLDGASQISSDDPSEGHTRALIGP